MNLIWFQNKWHILLISLPVIVLVLTIRNLIRGYSWKAKNGEELTLKEFFKSWGKGIEGITPLQQVKTQMLGTWIVVTGMISGLIINLLVRVENQWYWISIILVGSLIITSITMIGLYQKYKILKRVNQTMKEVETEEQPEIKRSSLFK